MKPWLWLPAPLAHELGPWALNLLSWIYDEEPIPSWASLQWRGLNFKNPLGIAGGVDKNADNMTDWWRLGAGFVEIGTVTPLPQKPNPGPIIKRNITQQALWNKMGFPSEGAREVFYNLKKFGPPFRTPIFLNIGKNRQTPNREALADYLSCVKSFESLAQVFVVNISSPNTSGLRDLQSPENLKSLIGPLKEHLQTHNNQPLLIKLSPDQGPDQLSEAVRICSELGIDGFVLTNTTTARTTESEFPKEGGVSGLPLKEQSRNALRIVVDSLGSQRQDKLIVSVGGVLSPEDVFERLRDGADLVQVYSALVFSGPCFFRQTYREWQKHGGN